ncbi:MAG: hypothetical protein GVY26_09405 [Bacteroidetes bacterium]|nr:hypothetical protein [Bacteroidota bacterium]
MAYRILLSSLIVLFLAVVPAQAAVKVPAKEQAEMSWVEKRAVRKQERRQKRVEKRLKRLKKRLEKRSDDEEQSNLGIWLIVIGSLLVLGGLVLGIFSFAAPLGGFFYFLSGLGLTFGLITLIFRIHRKND